LDKTWQGDYELTFRTAMSHDTASQSRPELRLVIGRIREKDVAIGSHTSDVYPFYSFPNLWVGDTVVKRGFDLALYPNQYHRYARSYSWRLRKQGSLITISISYDDGDTFETFLDWDCAVGFQPGFGVSCQHAALALDRVQLRQTESEGNHQVP
jgi:hypothetical protein